MSNLPIDGLHDGMRFGANQNCFGQVGVGERLERGEDAIPTSIPLLHQFGSGCGRHFELRIAIAVGLFAVAREEVGPSRAHVSRHVLDYDSNGIRFGIQWFEEHGVAALGHGALGQILVIPEQGERIGYVRIGSCMRHAESLTLSQSI